MKKYILHAAGAAHRKFGDARRAVNEMRKKQRRVLLAIALTIAAASGAWFYYSWHFQPLPQNTIWLMEDVRLPKRDERVLVFSPHQDDETIGAAGYIQRSIRRRAKVWVVLVTNGNKHRLEKMRYREFRGAAALLGVPESNLYFLGYPDTRLKRLPPAEVKSRLKEIIDEINPDIIVYPNPRDSHPDHAATGRYVLELMHDSNKILLEYLVHYPRFPRPEGLHPDVFMLPPTRMVTYDKEWMRLMLTDREVDVKLEATLQYKSQLYMPTPRGLMLGTVRKNELFAIPERNIH